MADINPKLVPGAIPEDRLISFVPMSAVEAGSGRMVTSVDRVWSEVRRGYTTFSEGDLLFAKITPCMENGKVAIASGLTNGYGAGSTEFFVLRPSAALDAKFLLFFLLREEFRGDARAQMRGNAGQLRVPKSFFDAVSIDIPPLAEQRRIVAEIETQFTRLDAAETALERARANLRRYRESVLLEVIDGPAEDVGSLLETPLVNGKSVGDRPDGFPVLRLTALRNGSIDTEQSKPGDWTAIEAQRYLIQEGDFLVARGNGSLSLVGRGGLVGPLQKSVAFPDTMIRIRCHRSRMVPEFLQLAWNSPSMRAQIETTARTTAGIFKISQKDIARFRLPVPPLHVQQDMVATANELLGAAVRTEVILNQSIAAAGFLRLSILQRAFSGKLVPQDPDDEPASVLLERIAAARANAAPPRRKVTARRTKEIAAEVQRGLL